MLGETEKEILECFIDGWIESGMKLPGDISYQEVFIFMDKLGIDPTDTMAKLAEALKKIIALKEKS